MCTADEALKVRNYATRVQYQFAASWARKYLRETQYSSSHGVYIDVYGVTPTVELDSVPQFMRECCYPTPTEVLE